LLQLKGEDLSRVWEFSGGFPGWFAERVKSSKAYLNRLYVQVLKLFKG